MSGEARKLHLIEALLKEENEQVLLHIESLLSNTNTNTQEKKSFKDFAGIISDEEADEWLKNIEEGCEQINADDWK